MATGSSFACECGVNGQTVGHCNSPALPCNLPGSCCESVFGG
jgi:hypothetical protein